jgi:hypothetical protein
MDRKKRQPNGQLLRKLEIYLSKKQKEKDGNNTDKRRDISE